MDVWGGGEDLGGDEGGDTVIRIYYMNEIRVYYTILNKKEFVCYSLEIIIPTSIIEFY